MTLIEGQTYTDKTRSISRTIMLFNGDQVEYETVEDGRAYYRRSRTADFENWVHAMTHDANLDYCLCRFCEQRRNR